MSNTNYDKGLKIDHQLVSMDALFRQLQLGQFTDVFIRTYGIADLTDVTGKVGDSMMLVKSATTGRVDIYPGTALLKDPSTGAPVLVNVPRVTTPEKEVAGSNPPGNSHLNSSDTWPTTTATKYVFLRYKTHNRCPVAFYVSDAGNRRIAPASIDAGQIDLTRWFKPGARLLVKDVDVKSGAALIGKIYTVDSVNASYLQLNASCEVAADGTTVATDLTGMSTDIFYVRPSAWYFSGYPSGDKASASIDNWELKLYTSSTGAGTEDEIYLAQVTWDAGGNVTTIVDKRSLSLLTFIPAFFRDIAPAQIFNLRYTWGIMERTPSGANLRDAVAFSVDEVFDYTPSKAWLRIKWGWKGHCKWVDSSTIRLVDLSYGNDTESYTFASNQLKNDNSAPYYLTSPYYVWVDGVKYKVVGNGAGSVPSGTIDISIVTNSGMPTDLSTLRECWITPDPAFYEVDVVPFDVNNNPAVELAQTHQQSRSFSPVEMEKTLQNMELGVTYGIKVRSSSGYSADQKSAWSNDAVQLGAGMTVVGSGYMKVKMLPTPPTMSVPTFDSVDGGVRVSFAPSPRAAAYMCNYTIDTSPPVPGQAQTGGVTNEGGNEMTQVAAMQHVYHLGPTSSLGFFIPAQPGTMIRAYVWCIDQYGQRSENTMTNGDGTLAGGVAVGTNEKVSQLQNRNMTRNQSSDPGVVGRIRIPNACLITEVAINCATWTSGTGQRVTTFSIYPEGQQQQSINITYGQSGLADNTTLTNPGIIAVSTDQIVNSGGWLVVTAWDGSGNSGFTNADIYVVYRENDVRIAGTAIAQTAGTNL